MDNSHVNAVVSDNNLEFDPLHPNEHYAHVLTSSDSDYTDTDDDDGDGDDDDDDNTNFATDLEQAIAAFNAFEDIDEINAAVITFVISAESNNNAKFAARYIAERITQDELSESDDEDSDNSVFFESAVGLTQGLLQMLYAETRLPFVDEYVMLLTSLRQKITREVPGDSEHILNLLILESTTMLLRVFELAFANDPDGLAGPELVSMWSSVLSQEGRMLCSRYMQNMEDTLTPCITSNTVGSIVAIQVVANLNGDKASTLAKLEPLFPQVQLTFQAVFTGELHAERMWGPGPLTKCIAQLSSLESVQQRIIASHGQEGPRDIIKGLESVLTFDNDDWPVKGFAAGYYNDARASACKVFYNLSQNHDVLSLRPMLQTSLENLLQPNENSPVLSAAVVANATAALVELAKYKLSVTADVLGQNIAGSLTGKISLVFVHETEKEFCHNLANDLTQMNKKVGLDCCVCSVNFHTHITTSAVIVVVLPSSKLHVSDNDRNSLRFALSLRKHVVIVENDQVLLDHIMTKIDYGQLQPIVCINKTNDNLLTQLLTQVLFM